MRVKNLFLLFVLSSLLGCGAMFLNTLSKPAQVVSVDQAPPMTAISDWQCYPFRVSYRSGNSVDSEACLPNRGACNSDRQARERGSIPEMRISTGFCSSAGPLWCTYGFYEQRYHCYHEESDCFEQQSQAVMKGDDARRTQCKLFE